jgi:hypothetical protein
MGDDNEENNEDGSDDMDDFIDYSETSEERHASNGDEMQRCASEIAQSHRPDHDNDIAQKTPGLGSETVQEQAGRMDVVEVGDIGGAGAKPLVEPAVEQETITPHTPNNQKDATPSSGRVKSRGDSSQKRKITPQGVSSGKRPGSLSPRTTPTKRSKLISDPLDIARGKMCAPILIDSSGCSDSEYDMSSSPTSGSPPTPPALKPGKSPTKEKTIPQEIRTLITKCSSDGTLLICELAISLANRALTQNSLVSQAAGFESRDRQETRKSWVIYPFDILRATLRYKAADFCQLQFKQPRASSP